VVQAEEEACATASGAVPENASRMVHSVKARRGVMIRELMIMLRIGVHFGDWYI
jgi:hypothetical protein